MRFRAPALARLRMVILGGDELGQKRRLPELRRVLMGVRLWAAATGSSATSARPGVAGSADAGSAD